MKIYIHNNRNIKANRSNSIRSKRYLKNNRDLRKQINNTEELDTAETIDVYDESADEEVTYILDYKRGGDCTITRLGGTRRDFAAESKRGVWYIYNTDQEINVGTMDEYNEEEIAEMCLDYDNNEDMY